MPVFAVTYTYGPDTDSRMEHRPAHRQWQSQMHEAGTILASGPLDDEPQPGGLLLMQAADRAEIERLLTGEPYASVGVIEDAAIRQWTPVVGPFAQDGISATRPEPSRPLERAPVVGCGIRILRSRTIRVRPRGTGCRPGSS